METSKALRPEWRSVHESPWPMFSMAWSSCPRQRCRLALGSCLEHGPNRIRVVEVGDVGRGDVVTEVEQPFPATKLMFNACDKGSKSSEFLASSSTSMNLWEIEGNQAKHVANLASGRAQTSSGHQPPLTSFDWSPTHHHKLATCSVDSTCTIWNIEKQKIEIQLIAHDKAVYDIAFCQMDHLFASVGADGQLRLFDQRNLDHSTIIYEAASPLLRLAWNKMNTIHIATIAMDVPGVSLIDIRRPYSALASLSYQDACVNHVCWAPHSSSHLLCGTDDGQALIWDAKGDRNGDPSVVRPRHATAPQVMYECGREIYQVQWPTSQPDHVALGTSRHVEVLQV